MNSPAKPAPVLTVNGRPATVDELVRTGGQLMNAAAFICEGGAGLYQEIRIGGHQLALEFGSDVEPLSPRSVLQEWVLDLPGLRHQGVLLAAVRGCDTAPRHDDSKLLSRSLRAEFLNAHVGDATKALTFIQRVDATELARRMKAFLDGCDQYPMHFVMHLIHAAEIVGYFHPAQATRTAWITFYEKACNKLHVRPEARDELDARLCADEDAFFAQQDTTIGGDR